VLFVLERVGIPWPVLALIAVVGVVLIVRDVRARRRGPSEAELRRQSGELSRAIYELLGDRRRDDPSWRAWHPTLPRDASKEEERRAFYAHTDKGIEHSTETMTRYKRRFGARALALFDEVVDRGLFDPGANPTDRRFSSNR